MFVGAKVGLAVGVLVGANVGLVVGVLVGANVGTFVGAKVVEPADGLFGGGLLVDVVFGNVVGELRRQPLGRGDGGDDDGGDEGDEGAADAAIGGAVEAELGAGQVLCHGEEGGGSQQHQVNVIEDVATPLERAAEADESEAKDVSGERCNGQVGAVAGVGPDQKGDGGGSAELGEDLVGPLDGGRRVLGGDGALLAPEHDGEGQDEEREEERGGLQAAGAGIVADLSDPLEEWPGGVVFDVTIVGESRRSRSERLHVRERLCRSIGATNGAEQARFCGRRTHLGRMCGSGRRTTGEKKGEKVVNSRVPKRSMTTSMARDVSEPAGRGRAQYLYRLGEVE